MMNADRPVSALGQSSNALGSTQLLVVGGGIMGLWAALKAARLGMQVTLIEKRQIGAGASGGLLGALMPYMPDKWDQKKIFQLESLLEIEREILELEAETKLSAGYRRSGRFIPLPKPHLRKIAERHEQDALVHWKIEDRQFYWQVEDYNEKHRAFDEGTCESGVIFDTLAARVSPRAYIQLLKKALERFDKVTVCENLGLVSIDHSTSTAHLSNGESLHFGHVIMAAGFEVFPLLEQAIQQPSDIELGRGIKGQSALLKANIDPASPVVFLNGLYIIPHEDGTVAIGSTSENTYEQPFSIDDKLDGLLQQAMRLMPALANAEVIERWAGLRPRAVAREPMIGAVADYPNIVALTGGFKVSFGIAHRLADAALAVVDGREPDLPKGFRLQEHIDFAIEKKKAAAED